MNIGDKIAVVTGGASGIGRAMASRFLQDGAKHVVIADLNEDQLLEVADEIGAQAITTDVANFLNEAGIDSQPSSDRFLSNSRDCRLKPG